MKKLTEKDKEGLEMKKQTLTSQQRLFVSEYLIDRNAKQAAIRAGYSAKTAEVQGSRLLSKDKVKELVVKKMTKLEEKIGLTAEMAMREVKAIATSNVMDGMEYDPNTREFSFKAPDEVPVEFWKAAQEITVMHSATGTGTVYRVKMHPKIQALKMEYDRHKLSQPETTTNNIANMHVNILEINEARRRAGKDEIKDIDLKEGS